MVDPVNSSGQVQPILSNTQQKKSQQTQEPTRSAPVDEVELSQEAISLSEAEESAKQVREALAEQTSETLSSDLERLSTLI